MTKYTKSVATDFHFRKSCKVEINEYIVRQKAELSNEWTDGQVFSYKKKDKNKAKVQFLQRRIHIQSAEQASMHMSNDNLLFLQSKSLSINRGL